MLFLLTGDVQIGKTRWLESLCASLQAAGTCVAGVVAPGQWVPRPEGQPGGKHGFDGAGRFEKLGIDNVLLPQGERIEFARRRDLAAGSKAFAEGAQAKAAKLGWAISDTAIAQVNSHFAMLAKQAGIAPADSGADDPTTAQAEVDTPAAAPLDNGVCPPVAAEIAAKRPRSRKPAPANPQSRPQPQKRRAMHSLPHQPPTKPNSPRTRCSWWTSWAASSFCADAA